VCAQAHNLGFRVHGFMVYGLWYMVYGSWFMVMVYGLWFMGYGFMVYGLRFRD